MLGPTINLLPTSLTLGAGACAWLDVLKPPADDLLKAEPDVLEFDKEDELAVLSGGFGVLDSRLPKSVSDRSMKSPENNCRDDVIKIE
jgi:hypothetical protein